MFAGICVSIIVCSSLTNVCAVQTMQTENLETEIYDIIPVENSDDYKNVSRFEQVNDRRFEDYNEIIAQFDQNALDIALNARTAIYLIEKNKSLDSETEQEASEIFNTFEYSAFTYVLTSSEILEQMDSAHTVDKQIIEKLRHNNHLIDAKLKHVKDLLQQLYSVTSFTKLPAVQTFAS